MTATATRFLYLTRHGDALADGSGLTESGLRQAALLGRRLADVPLSAVHHGPLPRAAQTAATIGQHLDGVPLHACEIAGDYLPHVPERAELPADSADHLLRFLAPWPEHERLRGPALAAGALERFTGPVEGTEERHELVVTHNFLIGWLVSRLMVAPKWRWLALNHCNAALTVIRYTPGRPDTVLLYNDMRHLPADLRWTGFPAELHM
ncbi:histidine phosphatase family protein [Streptomyces sp. NPDC049577]|uniref:histidine phosphatase family protein n=1 Tax=Streptomyces sp. NPDC049577 TaxID=3155153 RepID=UPI003433F3D9